MHRHTILVLRSLPRQDSHTLHPQHVEDASNDIKDHHPGKLWHSPEVVHVLNILQVLPHLMVVSDPDPSFILRKHSKQKGYAMESAR